MRPKKRILLIDSVEYRAGVLLFQLETNGFAVKSASSAEDALTIASAWSPELILAQYPLPQIDVAALFSDLRSISPFTNLAILSNAKDPLLDTKADAHIRAGAPMWEMLDKIKAMTMRKRGPREGSHHQRKAFAAAGPENADELRRIA
jgi:CheY-like chemotaxis protein